MSLEPATWGVQRGDTLNERIFLRRILPVELKEEISVPFEALALPPLPTFVLQVDGPAGGGREERHPEHHFPAQAGHASPGTCQVREEIPSSTHSAFNGGPSLVLPSPFCKEEEEEGGTSSMAS